MSNRSFIPATSIGERDPNFLRGLIQILPKKYTFFLKESVSDDGKSCFCAQIH